MSIFLFLIVYEPTWSKNATRINIKPGVVYPRVVYRILVRGLPSSWGELRSHRYIILQNHLYRPRAPDEMHIYIYLSRYILVYVSCLFCNRCCLSLKTYVIIIIIHVCCYANKKLINLLISAIDLAGRMFPTPGVESVQARTRGFQ